MLVVHNSYFMTRLLKSPSSSEPQLDIQRCLSYLEKIIGKGYKGKTTTTKEIKNKTKTWTLLSVPTRNTSLCVFSCHLLCK